MLDKLTLQYQALLFNFSDQKKSIEQSIDTFFALTLNGNYQHSIQNWGEAFEEQNQPVTVAISKEGIGMIGTVTLQFSKDSVSMISRSNPVISAIIYNSDFPQDSAQIAANDAFLKFGASLERFKQAWLLKNPQSESPKREIPLLKLSFFGVITTTTPQTDLSILIHEIELALQQQLPWREDSAEWENRSKIINVLTNYISTSNISRDDINHIRNIARILNGANANTFRKLSVAGIGISVPVFGIGVTFAALAIAGIFGGPFTAVPAAFVIAIGLIIFVGSAVYAGSAADEKPDFPSKAVLFLADEMKKTLFPDDHVPRSNISSDPSVIASQLKPQPPLFQPAGSPDFSELLDQLCNDTLKPAFQQISGKKEIDDTNEVYQFLRNGLITQYNQDISLDFLKKQINNSLIKENQEEKWAELCKVCGVEQSNTLKPF